MEERVRRPWGVTFVVVLTWIAALVDLAAGLAFLWERFRPADLDLGVALDPDQLWIYATAAILMGLLTAAIALGLAAGSQLSRVLVLLLMALRIAGAIYVYGQHGAEARSAALGEGAIALAVILMLASPRASAYFRRGR